MEKFYKINFRARRLRGGGQRREIRKILTVGE